MEWLAPERDVSGPADPAAQQRLHDHACINSSYAENDEFIPSVEGEFIPTDDSDVEYISNTDDVPTADAPAGGEGAGSTSGDGNGAGDGGDAQSYAEPDADVVVP
ncbi:Hypothetical predicted protein, partial [Olea europaea subsp. europaea]